MIKPMYIILAAIILLIVIAGARAEATTINTQCNFYGRGHVSCYTFGSPDLTSSPQILRVAPRVPDAILEAVCKPRVVYVDELGVEHVEYDNPKCRSVE